MRGIRAAVRFCYRTAGRRVIASENNSSIRLPRLPGAVHIPLPPPLSAIIFRYFISRKIDLESSALRLIFKFKREADRQLSRVNKLIFIEKRQVFFYKSKFENIYCDKEEHKRASIFINHSQKQHWKNPERFKLKM